MTRRDMVIELREAGLPSGQGLELRDDSFVAAVYSGWFTDQETRAEHEVRAKVRRMLAIQREMGASDDS